jgi:hypothetical protein
MRAFVRGNESVESVHDSGVGVSRVRKELMDDQEG